MIENYLMHYGVLGMKWGKKKQPESSNSSKKQRRQEYKQIRKDRKALNKVYNAEYKQKKALGKKHKNWKRSSQLRYHF